MTGMSTEQKLQRAEQFVRNKDLKKDAGSCGFQGVLGCEKKLVQRKYPRCKVCDLRNS